MQSTEFCRNTVLNKKSPVHPISKILHTERERDKQRNRTTPILFNSIRMDLVCPVNIVKLIIAPNSFLSILPDIYRAGNKWASENYCDYYWKHSRYNQAINDSTTLD